jgi:Tol biopolymer transport system component
MNKRYIYSFIIFVLALLSVSALAYILSNESVVIEKYNSVDRPAHIRPDYCRTVIPPNIAPLNFLVQENGSHYLVKISSKHGEPIEVSTRSPKITIPLKLWHILLNRNRGEDLHFDVFVKKTSGQWEKFETINNKIANENIDPFLVYRKIYPVHSTWSRIGIYLRNLENYGESLILDNRYYDRGCLNCHTFCANQTAQMLIGIRSSKYGNSTLLVKDGAAKKIGARFGYTSWHPSGRLAVYTINKTRQFFHSVRNEVRDVVDLDSALAYYLVDSKTVRTTPDLSRKDYLETYPAWSADGRYLYFCSAKMLWSDRNQVPPQRYDQVRYDLVRTAYDIETNTWGQLKTVLSAKDTGMSILEPRTSPDGRWLLFCMCDYGCFPVYQKSSDLYLLDLEKARQTGRYKYRRLNINSEQSESWHSWSTNSRWIVFSSKRRYGVFTRSYFSYIDQSGRVYKPLILPQKDPVFYDTCLKTYSVPELVVEPVKVTKEKLGRVVRSSRKIPVEIPISMATPTAATAPGYEEYWQQRE